MKAVLSFSLPGESEEFALACNATKYSVVLSQLDNWLRSETKYNDKECLREARKKLWELMAEQNLEI